MIDREILNNQFKKVFTALLQREVVVKGSRDEKSLTAFAEKLDTKGHIINQCLKGKRKITLDQADKLCQHFDVRKDYLLHARGAMFLSEQEARIQANSNAELSEEVSGSVYYSSAEVYASSTLDISNIEEGQYFKLPGLSGSFISFDVNGQSMVPTIGHGSMVICQLLEDKTELEEGKIYAIITKHGLMVKRAKRHLDENGDWVGLLLISDNASEYAPFIIDLEEIQQMLRVHRVLAAVD